MNEITRLLNAVAQGDPHATDQLLPLVYHQLRRLAAHEFAREAPGQTLDATALVNEAYLPTVGRRRLRVRHCRPRAEDSWILVAQLAGKRRTGK